MIYFMPYGVWCMVNGACWIMLKLDPNNNDRMKSVGEALLADDIFYIGTVVGADGCWYG